MGRLGPCVDMEGGAEVYFLVGMAMDGFRSDGKCVYLVLMVMGGPVEAFGMDRFEVL